MTEPSDYHTCDCCGDPAIRRTMYRYGKSLYCRDCYEASVSRNIREEVQQKPIGKGYQEHRK